MTKSVPHVRFEAEVDEELGRALEGVRNALLRHPIAAQAAFFALAAEGRRFAQTEEGAQVRERLAHSELFARLRIVWESLSMTAFDERTEAALPSFFLDGVVRAAADAGLESLLSRTFDKW